MTKCHFKFWWLQVVLEWYIILVRIPNFIINLQTEVYQAAHLCFLFCCGTTGPIHQNVGLASSMLFSPCAKFWACFFVTWGIALSLRQTGKREKAKVIEPLRAPEFHETCHSVTFYLIKKDSKRFCDTPTP